MDELTNFLIDYNIATKLERRGFYMSKTLRKNRKHVVAYYLDPDCITKRMTQKPIVDYAMVKSWLHEHNVYPCSSYYVSRGVMGWALVEQDKSIKRCCVVRDCACELDALMCVIDLAIDLIPTLPERSVDDLPF